jgi:hypothetical protein
LRRGLPHLLHRARGLDVLIASDEHDLLESDAASSSSYCAGDEHDPPESDDAPSNSDSASDEHDLTESENASSSSDSDLKAFHEVVESLLHKAQCGYDIDEDDIKSHRNAYEQLPSGDAEAAFTAALGTKTRARHLCTDFTE